MIVLASASPRRAALLEQIGIRFEVLPVDVDERPIAGESADDYVVRLAITKAETAARRGSAGRATPVLGADTAVVVDGAIFGKPADRADGMRMLRALSARSHDVVTAVAVSYQGTTMSRRVRSEVTFVELSESDIEHYWATGECADKAGGYGIQGIGGIFVERIHGSYSAIVGLPLVETELLLRSVGIATWRFRDG